ncbi:MAG: hypothetical protein K0S28_1440 [Paucimonas sp.]|nr:hypothetical protein [Paucimonas sp.]
MTWRYQLLQTAQEVFERHVDTQAPGATLTFSLPKVDATQTSNQVEIVRANKRIVLPMVSNTTFALIRDAEAAESDAMVVVNRNFPRGVMNHPNVQVRSPGLPDGVRRMGDLRLACAAQMEMVKAEGLKFRALFATASMFGLRMCDTLEVTKIDVPVGPYDTVTIEDDNRRLVQPIAQANPPQLGDKKWSDNARISYTVRDHIVQ